MARQTSKGLSGSIGNLVFYTRMGDQFVRSRPNVNRKKLLKNPEISLFREVTINGTPMIKMLKDQGNLLFPFSLATYNNMRGWIRNTAAANRNDWKLHVNTICSGQLNPESDSRNFISLHTSLKITDGKILLNFPDIDPQQVHAPSGTAAIRFKCIGVVSPYNEPCLKMITSEHFTIPLSGEIITARSVILSPQIMSPELMVLVVLAMEFISSDGMVNLNPKYLPAVVLGMGRGE